MLFSFLLLSARAGHLLDDPLQLQYFTLVHFLFSDISRPDSQLMILQGFLILLGLQRIHSSQLIKYELVKLFNILFEDRSQLRWEILFDLLPLDR